MKTLEKHILNIIDECEFEWVGYSFIQNELYTKYGNYRYINDDILFKVLDRLVNTMILECSKSIICYDYDFVIRDIVYKRRRDTHD